MLGWIFLAIWTLVVTIIRWVLMFVLGAVFGLVCMAGVLFVLLARFDFKPKQKAEKKWPNIGAKQIANKIVRSLGKLKRMAVLRATSRVILSARAQGSGAQTRLLRIRVIEAKDLVACDKERGTSDTFVRLQLGNETQKSKVAKKSLSPKWEYEGFLRVTQHIDQVQVLLEVCNQSSWSSAKILGSCVVRLAGVTKGAEKVLWLPLTGLAQTDSGIVRAKGEVHIAMELMDEPHAPVRSQSMPTSSGPHALTLGGSLDSLIKKSEETAEQKAAAAAARERAADLRRETLLSQTSKEREKVIAAARGSLAKKSASANDVLAGYLQIEDKDWIEYYFVLERAGRIRIATDEHEARAIGHIDLTGCSVRKRSKKCTFEVARRDKRNILHLEVESLLAADRPAKDSKKRDDAKRKPVYKLSLRAQSDGEAEQWLASVAKACPAAPPGADDDAGTATATADGSDGDDDDTSLRSSRKKEKEKARDAPSKDAGAEQIARQLLDEERRFMGGTASASASASAGGMSPVAALELRAPAAIEAAWGTHALRRIWTELTSSRIFLDYVHRNVKLALRGITGYDFLGPVALQSLDLGKQFFLLHKVRAATLHSAYEMLLEAEIEYPGGMSLSLATDLYINFPKPKTAIVPVQIHVSVNYMAGKFCLYGPGSLSERYRVFFSGAPTLQPNVRIEVGDKGREALNGTIKRIIYSTLNKSISNLLVHPAYVEFFLPYPGKLASAKFHSLKALAAPEAADDGAAGARRAATQAKEAAGALPLPAALGGPAPAAGPADLPAAVQTAIANANRVKPEVHAKRFVIARYFDEVLNRGELHVIPELFGDGCLVHGGTLAADQDLVGLDAMRDLTVELHNSFPDIMFSIEQLHVEGDFVYAMWTARGTYSVPLWGQRVEEFAATEIVMSGCTLSLFKFGNQKIAEHWFFWSRAALHHAIFPKARLYDPNA